MRFLRRILHAIAHATEWNHGRVETWWDGDVLMVGFRCNCGRLSHAQPSNARRFTPAEPPNTGDPPPMQG